MTHQSKEPKQAFAQGENKPWKLIGPTAHTSGPIRFGIYLNYLVANKTSKVKQKCIKPTAACLFLFFLYAPNERTNWLLLC